MVNKIEWIEPEDSTVGSVLVYRATDNIADALGSGTILATAAAKTGTGSWVLSYTDTTGTDYSVYRIQFWNGTGSSDLSGPISKGIAELLANFGEVKRAAKLSANSDIGSDEVYDSIKDASNWVYQEYGDPIKKTAIFLQSDSEDESYVFDFTGNMGPVYQIRRLTVDNGEYLVSGSSITLNPRDGTVKVASAFLTAHNGQWMRVEWVPQIVNDLVKYKAAMDLIETGMIIDGGEVTNPRFTKLERNFNEARETLRPKAIYAPRHVTDGVLIDSDSGVSEWADYVGQKLNRRSLRFT